MKHLNRIWIGYVEAYLPASRCGCRGGAPRSEALDRNLSLDFPSSRKARDNRNFGTSLGRLGKFHRLSMPPALLEWRT